MTLAPPTPEAHRADLTHELHRLETSLSNLATLRGYRATGTGGLGRHEDGFEVEARASHAAAQVAAAAWLRTLGYTVTPPCP